MSQKQDSNEYKEMLLLAYFQSNYKTYKYSEAVRILGVTYDELKSLIDVLVAKQLLFQAENYLIVTKNGEQKLFNEQMSFYFKEKSATNEIEKWDVNKPYIPIDFSL